MSDVRHIQLLREITQLTLDNAHLTHHNAHLMNDNAELRQHRVTQLRLLRDELDLAQIVESSLIERVDEANQRYARARRYFDPTVAHEERLIMMRMSANYQHAGDTDPEYLRGCTLVFIRSQFIWLDTRMKKVRALGKGTNKDAEVYVTAAVIQLMEKADRYKFPGVFADDELCGDELIGHKPDSD